MMPLATLAISIVQIINKLLFITVAGVLHERFLAEMITTNGAGRGRIVRSGKRSRELFHADFHAGCRYTHLWGGLSATLRKEPVLHGIYTISDEPCSLINDASAITPKFCGGLYRSVR